MGHEQSVRRVVVNDQSGVRDEVRGPAAADVDRRRHVAVAVDDQRRDRDGSQLIAEIRGETAQEEVPRSDRRAVEALPDLALHAGFSSRHVSFIETGRSQPSRQALLVLAEALEIPLRERNRLLEAGGYAHVYRHTPVAADEMAHIRHVLQFILDRHQPYAALVMDRYFNCLMGNAASGRLIAAIADPSLLTDHANLLRVTFHPLGARRWIVNWDEVAHHLLSRAAREFGACENDRVASALMEELRGYEPATAPDRPTRVPRPADLLLPIHIRKDHLDLSLFSTVMTLGTPQDVTLQELHVETFFPADPTSEATWRRLTQDA
jgi:transcriptional regulator with XRE-family HTH domain